MNKTIEELDKIDEINRMKDLSKYLEDNSKYSKISDQSYYNSNLDVDLDSLNEEQQEQAHQKEKEKSNNFSKNADISSSNEFKTFAAFERGDTESLAKLSNELHNKNTEITSLQLQLNHSRLQIQALSSRERQFRAERDALQFTVAEIEQDKLLLEMRVREIAGFEHQEDGVLLEEIRGKLLNKANKKISELMEAITEQQLQLEEKTQKFNEESQQKDSKTLALTQELEKLTNHLAQRTVLFSAQERRWVENSRAFEIHDKEKNNENVNLRARLEQLEKRYTEVDRERLEMIMKTRQSEAQVRELRIQLQNSEERLISLDSELGEAAARNLELQTTVDRLRGSDLAELEHSLTKEVEELRKQFKSREGFLKRQVEEAREQLVLDAEKREELLEELGLLRTQVSSQSQLLNEVNSSGLMGLKGNLNFSNFSNFQNFSERRVNPVQEGFEAISQLSGESQFSSIHENFSKNKEINRVNKKENEKIEKPEKEENKELMLSSSFLIGQEEFSQEVSQGENKGAGRKLENDDISFNRQISILQNNESVLKTELQRLKSFLSLVLKKAAAIKTPQNSEKRTQNSEKPTQNSEKPNSLDQLLTDIATGKIKNYEKTFKQLTEETISAHNQKWDLRNSNIPESQNSENPEFRNSAEEQGYRKGIYIAREVAVDEMEEELKKALQLQSEQLKHLREELTHYQRLVEESRELGRIEMSDVLEAELNSLRTQLNQKLRKPENQDFSIQTEPDEEKTKLNAFINELKLKIEIKNKEINGKESNLLELSQKMSEKMSFSNEENQVLLREKEKLEEKIKKQEEAIKELSESIVEYEGNLLTHTARDTENSAKMKKLQNLLSMKESTIEEEKTKLKKFDEKILNLEKLVEERNAIIKDVEVKFKMELEERSLKGFEEVQEKNKEIEVLKGFLSGFEKTVEDTENKFNLQLQELQEEKKKNEELLLIIEKHLQTIKEKEEKIELFANETTEKEKGLNEELSEERSLREHLKNELVQKDNYINELKFEISEKKVLLTKVEEKRYKLIEKVGFLEKEIIEKERVNSSTKSDKMIINSLNESITEYREELDFKNGIIKESKERIQLLCSTLEEKEKLCGFFKQTIKDGKDQIQDLKNQITQNNSIIEVNSKLQSELEKTKTQIKTLESQLQTSKTNFEEQITTLESELRNSNLHANQAEKLRKTITDALTTAEAATALQKDQQLKYNQALEEINRLKNLEPTQPEENIIGTKIFWNMETQTELPPTTEIALSTDSLEEVKTEERVISVEEKNTQCEILTLQRFEVSENSRTGLERELQDLTVRFAKLNKLQIEQLTQWEREKGVKEQIIQNRLEEQEKRFKEKEKSFKNALVLAQEEQEKRINVEKELQNCLSELSVKQKLLMEGRAEGEKRESDLQRWLDRLEGEVNATKIRNVELQIQLQQLQEEKKLHCRELETQLSQEKKHVLELQEVRTQEGSIQVLKESIKTLETELEQTKIKRTEEEGQKEQLQRHAGTLRDELSSANVLLREQCQLHQQQMTMTERKVGELQAKVDVLERELVSSREKSQNHENSLKQRIATLEDGVQHNYQQLQVELQAKLKLEERAVTAEHNYSQFQVELQETQKQKSQLEEKCKEVEQRSVSLENELQNSRTGLKEAQNKIEILEKDVKGKEEEYMRIERDLTDKIEFLQGEKDSLMEKELVLIEKVRELDLLKSQQTEKQDIFEKTRVISGTRWKPIPTTSDAFTTTEGGFSDALEGSLFVARDVEVETDPVFVQEIGRKGLEDELIALNSFLNEQVRKLQDQHKKEKLEWDTAIKEKKDDNDEHKNVLILQNKERIVELEVRNQQLSVQNSDLTNRLLEFLNTKRPPDAALFPDLVAETETKIGLIKESLTMEYNDLLQNEKSKQMQLHHHIASLREQLLQQKKKIAHKYKQKLIQQHHQHQQQQNEMIGLVHQECAIILQEAKNLLLKQNKAEDSNIKDGLSSGNQESYHEKPLKTENTENLKSVIITPDDKKPKNPERVSNSHEIPVEQNMGLTEETKNNKNHQKMMDSSSVRLGIEKKKTRNSYNSIAELRQALTSENNLINSKSSVSSSLPTLLGKKSNFHPASAFLINQKIERTSQELKELNQFNDINDKKLLKAAKWSETPPRISRPQSGKKQELITENTILNQNSEGFKRTEIKDFPMEYSTESSLGVRNSWNSEKDGVKIYPEMLSPERTKELIQQIVLRSSDSSDEAGTGLKDGEKKKKFPSVLMRNKLNKSY